MIKWLCSLFLVFVAFNVAYAQGEDGYKLVKKSKIGVLSTDYKGAPFGSLTPYVLHEGRPVIFISDLAIHTENIKKNSACSLTVFKIDKKNLFNSSRITFIGKMVKVPEKELDAIKKMYFDRFKDAKQFKDFQDFNFYKMEIKEIFWVGGFGDIQWLDVRSFIELFLSEKQK